MAGQFQYWIFIHYFHHAQDVISINCAGRRNHPVKVVFFDEKLRKRLRIVLKPNLIENISGETTEQDSRSRFFAADTLGPGLNLLHTDLVGTEINVLSIAMRDNEQNVVVSRR